MNQGLLAALLPFLIAAYHYDYTTAASLVMISNLVGSVIQPVFGHIADKKSNPNLMIVGIILAGGGMAFTGVISNFAALCVAVVISGIGVAMFHPQGAQMVNRYSVDNDKATNMGIFAFGGNAGFTVGPMLATLFITLFGLKGTLIFLVPPIIFGVATRMAFKPESEDIQVAGNQAVENPAEAASLGEDKWGSFVKMGLLISMRSIVFGGVNTFLVLYFIDVLGKSEALSNGLLSFYYAMGAASAILGGKLADTIGIRKTIRISFMILLPALIIFTVSHNFLVSILMLIPMGFGFSACYSPSVILAQMYLPNRTGLASGVTLGLSVSVGGIVVPLFGMIGDAYGLGTTYAVISGLAVILLIISFILDEPEQHIGANS